MEIFMKKKVTIAVSMFFLLFLFCSCQNAPVVWDSSFSDESMATVRFINMKIDSFNEIEVTKFNWVKIPAGEARLGGEVYISHAGFDFRLRGMQFTYTFGPGRDYIIQGRSQDMLWGVAVFEASSYSQVSEKTFLAFVPFRNQPEF
jgi:hypothetical protein